MEDEFATNTFIWPRDATVFLIGQVKQNFDIITKAGKSGAKKKFFEEVTKQLNKMYGTDLYYEQAESKWKGLRRTYKNIKNHQLTTGKIKRQWEFFDLIDEIYYETTEITIATLSTESDLIEEENELIEESYTNDSSSFKWTKDITYFLINKIKEKYDKLQPGVKVMVYKYISKTLNEKFDTKLTYRQIESKWKCLKYTYYRIKENQLNSHTKRKRWEYFNIMHEILSDAPETILARNKNNSIVEEEAEEQIYASENDDTDCMEETEQIFLNEEEEDELQQQQSTDNNHAECNPIKKRRLSDSCDEQEQQTLGTRESNRERRHRERMKLTERFLDLFEKMIDKM